jgi:hypothetical protein
MYLLHDVILLDLHQVYMGGHIAFPDKVDVSLPPFDLVQ